MTNIDTTALVPLKRPVNAYSKLSKTIQATAPRLKMLMLSCERSTLSCFDTIRT
jgi:hypothetical protein